MPDTDTAKTSDRAIERAADLWFRMMKRPKFDNGDNSLTGMKTVGLAAMLVDAQTAQVDDLDTRLVNFRDLLVARLKLDRDRHGQPLTKEDADVYRTELKRRGLYRNDENERYWSYRFERRLSCDYHPCTTLREVAAAAGVPDSLFSWKTDVDISYPYEGQLDHVTVSAGYAASSVYHYPLPDGRWLLSKGFGGEADTIIAAVVRGELAGVFQIEEAAL